MAWVPLRKATKEDCEKLEKCAKAFAERHNLDLEGDIYTTTVDDLESLLELLIEDDKRWEGASEGKYLWRLWKRACNRAIGDDGIAYGYVGHLAE